MITLDPEVPESPDTLQAELKSLIKDISVSESKLNKYSEYTVENKSDFLDVSNKLKKLNREKISSDNSLYS